MHTPTPSLRVEDVHVWRGERHVLQGVNFEIQPGNLLHIAGSNGAGKTTLLRVVCGLIAPEMGEVLWQGRNIRTDRESFQASFAFAAHDAALKADLTALENLRFTIGLRRSAATPELLDAMQRTGSHEYANLPARVLSAGQRRRVAMARVLASRVPLWLLDEPFSNLDAAGVTVISALIDEHVAGGGAAVIVAHHGLSAGPRVSELVLSA